MLLSCSSKSSSQVSVPDRKAIENALIIITNLVPRVFVPLDQRVGLREIIGLDRQS